jgi:hypothetical protein
MSIPVPNDLPNYIGVVVDESDSRAHYESLWRASANEAVPYPDDYPECLITLPELYDGSRAAQATLITTEFYFPSASAPPGTPAKLIVRDNGHGFLPKDEERFLQWASKKATTLHNRYGHGSKKMLSKWMPNYKNAKWSLSSRAKQADSLGSLMILQSPYLGPETLKEYKDEDHTTLGKHGAEWTIEFDQSILSASCTGSTVLFAAVKELILTRYNRRHLRDTTFELSVYEVDTLVKHESSSRNRWQTFEEALQKEYEAGRAIIAREAAIRLIRCSVNLKQYKLLVEGNKRFPLKDNFPRYGGKNMKSTRVHMSIEGRTIEAKPNMDLMPEKVTHNSDNGYITLADFIPDQADDFESLPTPCTTKVKFNDQCQVFKLFREKFREFMGRPEQADTRPPCPAFVATLATLPKASLANLKEECKRRGLSVKGNKSELYMRVQQVLSPPVTSLVAPVSPPTPTPVEVAESAPTEASASTEASAPTEVVAEESGHATETGTAVEEEINLIEFTESSPVVAITGSISVAAVSASVSASVSVEQTQPTIQMLIEVMGNITSRLSEKDTNGSLTGDLVQLHNLCKIIQGTI